MNRKVLRLGVCVGVVLFAVEGLAASGPSILERLGKLLGLDKGSMARVTRPRSAADCGWPVKGTSLLKLDCDAKTESLLWRCEECWSPVSVGDAGIAVIRKDGLWLVEAPEKARKLVDGPGFVSLLGLTVDGGKSLVVVRERPEGGRPVLGLVDLSTGAFAAAPTQPATNEEAKKLGHVRPASLQGTRLLSPVERGGKQCGAREVRVEPERGKAKERLCEFQPVPDAGSWDRFDPAWSGDDVVYVAKPLD
ncbi:hypothetical protein [Archangium sp.]|jgi:hypothetical protein|uniref:hypothetical protein n=1 Tax=Archangium sp. TaxID=1872627 RepID=UPI002EDA5E5E